MRKRSLRARLVIAFCILITLAWVVSTSISYIKTRHRIRYIFDAQQLVFAQRLEDSNLNELLINPSSSSLLKLKQSEFKKADDALSFAIFNHDGDVLLTDRSGVPAFHYDPSVIISDSPTFYNSDEWRVLWYKTTDQRFIIAVGQENAYRNKLTRDIITDHQITPWFIIMPILIAAIILVINRELAPIKHVSRSLNIRSTDDRTPIKNDDLPLEIEPLISSLNTLFERISLTIEQERRFVSNAAHELRSPLAALQVQAEVAQLSVGKPNIQQHALKNLTVSIARASHLIDQLLTLSKLDSFSQLQNIKPIDWVAIIDSLIRDCNQQAEDKHLSVVTDMQGTLPTVFGDPLLLAIMIRNLIDNALRYTQDSGNITMLLTQTDISILDNGPGISTAEQHQIGQRFYRPPGQKETGSGLGLSITKQIAELHGFTFTFGNRQEGGFYSKVSFNHQNT